MTELRREANFPTPCFIMEKKKEMKWIFFYWCFNLVKVHGVPEYPGWEESHGIMDLDPGPAQISQIPTLGVVSKLSWNSWECAHFLEGLDSAQGEKPFPEIHPGTAP